MTFFAGELSPLSNLHPCNITVQSVQWKSTEHFYQFNKCKDLGRSDLASEVYCAKSPREAMTIGGKVRPNNDWVMSRGLELMKTAVEAKFSVPAMRQALLNTQGLIVEATRNSIFGIGLPFTSPNLSNKHEWKGGNLMGQILTDYRECIKDQLAHSRSQTPPSTSHGHSQQESLYPQINQMFTPRQQTPVCHTAHTVASTPANQPMGPNHQQLQTAPINYQPSMHLNPPRPHQPPLFQPYQLRSPPNQVPPVRLYQNRVGYIPDQLQFPHQHHTSIAHPRYQPVCSSTFTPLLNTQQPSSHVSNTQQTSDYVSNTQQPSTHVSNTQQSPTHVSIIQQSTTHDQLIQHANSQLPSSHAQMRMQSPVSVSVSARSLSQDSTQPSQELLPI